MCVIIMPLMKSGDKMIINKVYKFRLYPNKNYQELINKTLTP